MLEVKNLTKVYSTKGGVTVRALDDVSVVFPEKGMVFLLGRSGSGKSTLLNVAGGLDKPDGGEVIVKGKSSKDFSGSDFDSYRNTFIGFVFQEYNILNEFTIEQNIALALQLQSKPNDRAAVAALLEQVDLAGYAKRKPNTLSGGQKQRVAIARALIKEPEIIMADEPTGALDSATGKQVLDTLKKLSEQKLVIVVSHDREFAEQYGDRIIELKDGKIISDVTKVYNAPKDITGEEAGKEELPNVAMISEDTIAIRKGEELTDDDIKKIATLLRKKGGEAIITADERDLPGVKRACKINENGDKESFKDTVPPKAKEYDGSKTKFIKSKLPMGHAIKMGASGLKSKPIRLIFTIILAVAAFVLFGVVSTFMLYDPDYSISVGLGDAGYKSMKLNKTFVYTRTSMRIDNATGEESEEYSYDSEANTLFGASEVSEKNKSGLQFAGVFTYNQSPYQSSESATVGVLKDGNSLSPSVPANLKDYYPTDNLYGFTDCGKDYLDGIRFTITGNYPTKPTEIMLSEYFAEMFVQTEGNGVTRKEDLVGKKVRLNGFGFNSKEFTVSGIVYTGEIPAKYEPLKTAGNQGDPTRVALKESLDDYLSHGFETLIYVSADFYEAYSENIRKDNYGGASIPSKYVNKLRIDTYYIYDDNVENYGNSYYTEKTLEKYGNQLTFHNLKGATITTPTLGDGEIYVYESKYNDMMRSYLYSHNPNTKYDAEAYAELGSSDDINNIINNVKNFSADSDFVKKLAKWYPTLAYRNYLYDNGYNLRNYLENNKTNKWTDARESFVAFNDVTYVGTANQTDLELLQAFVDERQQVYYGWIAGLEINKSGWTDEFLEGGETDPYEVIDRLKNGSYSADEFATRKPKLDAWFTSVGRSTDVEDYFSFDTDGEKGTETVLLYCLTKAEKAFLATFQKIGDYLYGSEKDDAEEITAADWAAMEAAFKAKEQWYYGMLLTRYLDENYNDSKQTVTIGEEDAVSLANNLRYGNISDSDFATLKPTLDAWFAEREASVDLKDYFTFDITEAITDSTLYWLDKNGNRGELTIVGYFEGQYYSYLIKEDFLLAHGEAQNDNNPYSYYEETTTKYVEPADAKYNSIISLTDNSMGQISAALATEGDVVYHIDNAVAQELDNFLEMITDLGEIFLYVGLGVGVLAAFFLLNFISVSIASKRKDIGILRAVGARGSDVFKIFYAEAFIIALICFILASVGSYVLCFFLNRTISEKINISLLNFGPINIALIFGISVFVSVIATFLPVYFAARKSPVDSIRAL